MTDALPRANRSILTAMFLLLLLAAATWLLHGTFEPSDKDAAGVDSGIVTMMAINDVYRIEGINGGRAGGLSRVAWLRAHLAKKTDAPVPLLHAGDALSPSLYSLQGRFDGAEMVDILNHLDGSSGSFDKYLFTTIGNHEFDRTDCQKDAGLKVLNDRINQSEFTWLSGNLDYSQCTGWTPGSDVGRIEAGKTFTVKGMTFGVFGLTLAFESGKAAAERRGPLIDQAYVTRAKELTASLRAKGAEFVIGVTHLPWACDLKILDQLGADGPDLIMGGHDHVRMVHTSPHDPALGAEYRAVYKASSDATDLALYDFWRGEDGKITYAYSARDMDITAPTSAVVDKEIKVWDAKLDAKLCGANTGCLDAVQGATAYEWALLEHENRSGETRVGNWFADLMLEQAIDDGTFCKGHGGVVSLINSGTFRLNYDIPKGAQLRDRQIRGTMPYGAALTQLCVPGSMLYKGLVNGLSHPGEGRYPHISGMSVIYKRDSAGQAQIFSLKIGGKQVPEDDDTPFLLVTGAFLAGNSDDGYPFHTVAGSDRLDLSADLLKIVPDSLGRQTMTPAIDSSNRRKKELPGQAPAPTCGI